MSETDSVIKSQAEADRDYAVGLREYFHMHPELSAKEFHTQEKIEEELHKVGLKTKRIAKTGVMTEIKGEKPGGRTIVLRADIDALPVQEQHECAYKSQNPGVMHACGHDMHCSSLIEACRLLAKNRSLFGGTVRVTFQPGEEIGYGAHLIVNEGDLKGCGRSFGLHAASDVPVGKVAAVPGPNNASVDWFNIHVTGKGVHVSTPQLGVDAAYIAAQIVVAAQALVTRRTDPMENVLLGIGKITAGNAYNVVAEKADIEGTIRVFSQETRKKIREELADLSEKIAAIYGGTAEVAYEDNTSPLINDPESTKEVQTTLSHLIGKENVVTDRRPSLGGDDFAEFNLRVPGCYAYVGTRNEKKPNTTCAHHDSHFDIDEDAVVIAAEVYAAYAIDYLNGTFD
ncbi:MAG: M20 metallopeptidase family protein [Lachnospiraceae bacterium]|jgi:amidohydrolase